MRPFWVIISVLSALVLVPPPARACSPAGPSLYNAAQGTDAPPPAISIRDVEVRLRCGYGGPGPGDCSDLGFVVISVATPDGQTLDGKFGVAIKLLSGRLPVVRADGVDKLVFAITNNQVQLTIADQRSYAKFAFQVQAVNRKGVRGALSAKRSVYKKKDRCIRLGCFDLKLRYAFPLLAIALLGCGLFWMVRRRSRKQRRG